MQIDRRENIDPDALEGFGFAYQLIMNLCPPASALPHFFTVAGASSNEAGMKRLLARISNRHSVREPYERQENQSRRICNQGHQAENSGAYAGWEEDKRREHISKILFAEKFGVSWDEALVSGRRRHKSGLVQKKVAFEVSGGRTSKRLSQGTMVKKQMGGCEREYSDNQT